MSSFISDLEKGANSESIVFGEGAKAFSVVKWTPEGHHKTNLARKEKKETCYINFKIGN